MLSLVIFVECNHSREDKLVHIHSTLDAITGAVGDQRTLSQNLPQLCHEWHHTITKGINKIFAPIIFFFFFKSIKILLPINYAMPRASWNASIKSKVSNIRHMNSEIIERKKNENFI